MPFGAATAAHIARLYTYILAAAVHCGEFGVVPVRAFGSFKFH